MENGLITAKPSYRFDGKSWVLSKFDLPQWQAFYLDARVRQ